MVKVISMMKRKEGMSIEEFREWAFEHHTTIGKQFPKIRHYRMSVVQPEHADGPYDAVSELYFDTLDDFKAALDSEFGAQAGADIKEHCDPNRFRMVTDELVVIP